MKNKEKILILNNIYKHFGVTKAVDGVDLEINQGEIHGLVGENGSGKSTTMSIISGILKPDSGKMFLNNQPYEPQNQAIAISQGVTMIVQEINTLADLTVAENIFLGQEDQFIKYGIRNLKKMNVAARKFLDAAGLTMIKETDNVDKYSIEQRKMIELVKATCHMPKLLMIDETSTALSHKGREELYRLMRTTKESGGSVIFISHDLKEVLTLCDTISVLRDGKKVGDVLSKDMDEEKLKTLMVGREISNAYYRTDYDEDVESSETVLEVKNLSCGNTIKDISFELKKGEILGFGGLSESGMHELGKAIYGVAYDVKADIYLPNENKHIKTINDALKHGVGYISKNRDTESLYNTTTIKDNISISAIDVMKKNHFVTSKDMDELSEKYADFLDIKMRNINQIVGTLSGGNKQKVVLAKWLARDTNIFIMDSPTRGIDVAVKAIIYDLLFTLKKQGKSMIIISEELLELIGCCDRILMIREGEISQEFKRSRELNENDLVQSMI